MAALGNELNQGVRILNISITLILELKCHEKDAAISLRINPKNPCHNEFKVLLSILVSELSDLSQKHKTN